MLKELDMVGFIKDPLRTQNSSLFRYGLIYLLQSVNSLLACLPACLSAYKLLLTGDYNFIRRMILGLNDLKYGKSTCRLYIFLKPALEGLKNAVYF